MKNKNEIFENLFVLEVANNHLGDVDRGLKIIRNHATIVKFNSIKAAIKLQFRNVSSFIHEDFKGNSEHRYIKKTEATELSKSGYSKLIEEIRQMSCIPMATPFDESSVDLCVDFDLPIIKVASSDINDWVLLDRIAFTKKPVIISSGGASEKNLDDVVLFFENRNIPLGINHCVSLYPTEDSDLQLDQIDYLKARYQNHIIGLSTHEYNDWQTSMLISYAKGARLWERHIDIELNGIEVTPYCSLPEQCDIWYKAYNKAKEMCGNASNSRRVISKKETAYLDQLVRGVYCNKSLKAGYIFDKTSFAKDFYLSIPLKKGQLSCREIINGEMLIKDIEPNESLTINHIDGPYNENKQLKKFILNRGI